MTTTLKPFGVSEIDLALQNLREALISLEHNSTVRYAAINNREVYEGLITFRSTFDEPYILDILEDTIITLRKRVGTLIQSQQDEKHWENDAAFQSDYRNMMTSKSFRTDINYVARREIAIAEENEQYDEALAMKHRVELELKLESKGIKPTKWTPTTPQQKCQETWEEILERYPYKRNFNTTHDTKT